jgi:hypothetical protein
LLEAVIAIGILLAGVVGSLVLINSTINLGRANQDRIVAQNLAREGIELVYSLRNSASLAYVEDQTISWDSYITRRILKSSNISDYENKYEIGFGEYPGNCRVRNSGDPSESLDGTISTGEATCDIWVLADYLFIRSIILPPMCDSDTGDNLPTFSDNTNPLNFHTPCDYNKSDGSSEPTIGDISWMVDQIFLQSYQLIYSFPSINLETPLDSRLIFPTYTPASDLFDPQAVMWENPLARVYELNNTYVQGSTPGTPTKFYRVVSVQSVCRGNRLGQDTEFIIPTDNLLNCNDYARAAPDGVLGWTNSEAAGVQKVGGLVTSEVRWPTPTSSTKMKYQEFIYDWINV